MSTLPPNTSGVPPVATASPANTQDAPPMGTMTLKESSLPLPTRSPSSPQGARIILEVVRVEANGHVQVKIPDQAPLYSTRMETTFPVRAGQTIVVRPPVSVAATGQNISQNTVWDILGLLKSPPKITPPAITPPATPLAASRPTEALFTLPKAMHTALPASGIITGKVETVSATGMVQLQTPHGMLTGQLTDNDKTLHAASRGGDPVSLQPRQQVRLFFPSLHADTGTGAGAGAGTETGTGTGTQRMAMLPAATPNAENNPNHEARSIMGRISIIDASQASNRATDAARSVKTNLSLSRGTQLRAMVIAPVPSSANHPLSVSPALPIGTRVTASVITAHPPPLSVFAPSVATASAVTGTPVLPPAVHAIAEPVRSVPSPASLTANSSAHNVPIPAPVPATGKTTAQAFHGMEISASVTAVAKNGQATLQTPLGLLLLDTNRTLTSGVSIRMGIEKVIFPTHPLPAQGAGEMETSLMLRTRQWPSFDALTTALKTLSQDTAEDGIQSRTRAPMATPPNTIMNTAQVAAFLGTDLTSLLQISAHHAPSVQSNHLLATMLLFMGVLQQGSLQGWMRGDMIRWLERTHPSLMHRLSGDIKRFGDTLDPNRERHGPDGRGDWRGALIPIVHNGESTYLGMYFHQHKTDDTTEPRPQAKNRFLIDLSLSRAGHLQLDGLVSPQERHLSLMIRTQVPLPPAVMTPIRSLFTRTNAHCNYGGDITFIASKDALIDFGVPSAQPMRAENLLI